MTTTLDDVDVDQDVDDGRFVANVTNNQLIFHILFDSDGYRTGTFDVVVNASAVVGTVPLSLSCRRSSVVFVANTIINDYLRSPTRRRHHRLRHHRHHLRRQYFAVKCLHHLFCLHANIVGEHLACHLPFRLICGCLHKSAIGHRFGLIECNSWPYNHRCVEIMKLISFFWFRTEDLSTVGRWCGNRFGFNRFLSWIGPKSLCAHRRQSRWPYRLHCAVWWSLAIAYVIGIVQGTHTGKWPEVDQCQASMANSFSFSFSVRKCVGYLRSPPIGLLNRTLFTFLLKAFLHLHRRPCHDIDKPATMLFSPSVSLFSLRRFVRHRRLRRVTIVILIKRCLCSCQQTRKVHWMTTSTTIIHSKVASIIIRFN